MPTFSCQTCKVVKDGKRLPRGWYSHKDDLRCDICKKKAFVLRAVTVPVSGPELGREWPEFREALKACWVAARAISNRVLTGLAVADPGRIVGSTRLAQLPAVYLYPELCAAHPEADPASVSALTQSVGAKYKESRYQIIGTGEQSLPVYRYPTPYPIRGADWTVEEQAERHFLKCRLNRRPWRIRLTAGPNQRYWIQRLRLLASGAVKQGEASIYAKRVGDRDPDKSAGVVRIHGVRHRVMCKMVAWFPVQAPSDLSGVMRLRRDPLRFWIAEMDGRDPFVLNGDHILRAHIAHEHFRQRMAEDLKFEKRWPVERRRQMLTRLDERCAKHHRRLESWRKESVAVVAGFAQRQRVATVEYDESTPGFLESFPWFVQREALRSKLEEYGIEFVASGESVDDGESPDMPETIDGD